ncbi:HotDog domain-containing protein [Xylariales sp. AK1849]|nr:HotDog domain-containing protein [Xylariales sp. AK1849]
MTFSRTSLRHLARRTATFPKSQAPRSRTPLFPQRVYSSSASSTSSPVDINALRDSMLARPEQLHYDVLSPMPSQLLNIALSDYLPASALPSPLYQHPPWTPPPTSSKAPSRHTLPEAYHLVHFPLQLPPSGLCPDGTDPYHLPAAPFERRMWAGGSMLFNTPFRMDKKHVLCRERIEDVQVKGKPGEEKIFVHVLRRYGVDGFEVGGVDEYVTERRTLVFMPPVETKGVASNGKAAGTARIVKTQHTPSFTHTLTPTPTLLAQYSALTYNAHQIHINPQYCREVEGHRDLLVHGPLSLTLMLCVLRSRLGGGERIKSVDYRHLAPLYVGEPLTVCVRPSDVDGGVGEGRRRQGSDGKWDVWVEDKDGSLSVKGSALVG